jgi:uncharacterized protein YndB with AHSA1/START domain
VNGGPTLPEGATTERWIHFERSLRATTERVFRVWTDPEELPRWLPDRLEGSLAPNSRSVLVWRRERLWWDVVAVEPNDRFSARIPWTPDESLVTTFTVLIAREGYGSRLSLDDGPFPIDRPGGLDAWARAIESWTEALANLRAFVDFSVDLRNRG